METKNFKIISLLYVAHLVAAPSAQTKKPENVDVVAACKSDCPDAKSNAEAHECAERKGKIRPTFKKTKCWEVNEEYEELVKGAAPSKGK